MVSTVTADAQGHSSKKFFIHPKEFPFLKGLNGSFERWRITRCVVYWQPAVGSTQNGMMTMGVDWNATSHETVTPEMVAAYTPSKSTPVWQSWESRGMALPPDKLMNRKWYSTDSETENSIPGVIYNYATGTKSLQLGQIWIEYEVHFSGTRAA